MSSNKYKKQGLQHWQVIALFLLCYDILAVNISYLIALWLRFDFRIAAIPSFYMDTWKLMAIWYTIFSIVVFYYLRLYRSVWRFASYSEFLRVISSSIITGAFYVIVTLIIGHRMPLSYYVIGLLIQTALILGARFSYRFYLFERDRRTKSDAKNIMLIGAGAAGQSILRELRQSNFDRQIKCIIDDNSNKWNRYIEGVPVVGGRQDILLNAEKYHIDEIYVAMPSAGVEDKREILNICKETGCELKNLPGLYQLVNGEVNIADMREVRIEDLLGRDPIKVEMGEIFHSLSDKVILVTGGGGSIGSELSRQIAGHNPKQLIIFDIYENNAYEIEQELKKKYPNLNLKVLIGSVRDSKRLNQIFKEYKPDIVYHAAAHKHVPLMEGSPCEAIKNNVIGTYKTAYAALANGCSKFVLISTDKAVNPTNIMGASKRLCEMVIQSFDSMVKAGKAQELPMLATHAGAQALTIPQDAETEFVAVRFGNVLGSNGSVIPLFKKQIAAGGPVTVTHPDIIRYFMTIPEAVSLVLQAGTYAKGGEIFVLDMGAPVKIDNLARNLIKLSGLKPDVDIEIIYTGLRPGEKLYEEKLMAEEGMKKTPNELIQIGSPIPFDTVEFLKSLATLMKVSYDNNELDIRQIVADVVPTYHPAGEKGSENKGQAYEEQRKLMAEKEQQEQKLDDQNKQNSKEEGEKDE